MGAHPQLLFVITFASAMALGQVLLICIAVNPRKWRRFYYRHFPASGPASVTKAKIVDETWSGKARRLALAMLLLQVALALWAIASLPHSDHQAESTELRKTTDAGAH